MNLVVSGPIDDHLRSDLGVLSATSRIVLIHPRAIRFEGCRHEPATRAAVATICSENRVDHAYVDPRLSLSHFKLLAIDMDSTLISIECIDEIADYAGKKSEIAAITTAAMRGEISDFGESLRRRVALLRGLDVSVLQRVYEERLQLTDGAAELVNAMAAHRAHTMLLSGGFTYFTERLASLLSFSANYANKLEISNGLLTGTVSEPIFDGAAKAEVVNSTLHDLRLASDEALVIGDGANDIPMMDQVRHSVAYRAKPATNARAKYAVRFGSLSVILDYFHQAPDDTGMSFA